ncbi:MAG: hypothetical protein FWB74_04505 [Defluviitaleaceae bacterium]|nr:hypothetical protein [Defluviitaleaceae bacterium]
MLIESTNAKVESGSAIANTTAQSLDRIVGNTGKVKDIISTIADASSSQAEAEELNSQAETLQQLVAYFKLY